MSVGVSSNYYDKSAQYGTGERRDAQLRSRFVGTCAFWSLKRFILLVELILLTCLLQLVVKMYSFSPFYF